MTAALAMIVGRLSGSAVLAMLTLFGTLGVHLYLRSTRCDHRGGNRRAVALGGERGYGRRVDRSVAMSLLKRPLLRADGERCVNQRGRSPEGGWPFDIRESSLLRIPRSAAICVHQVFCLPIIRMRLFGSGGRRRDS
jgi:hypothetical protein